MIEATKQGVCVPDPSWLCTTCKAIKVNPVRPDDCPYCEGREIREVNTKEEMVRMAERIGCRIEIVNQSEVLTRFGGVGCLLRYITPDSALRIYGRTFRRETSVH